MSDGSLHNASECYPPLPSSSSVRAKLPTPKRPSVVWRPPTVQALRCSFDLLDALATETEETEEETEETKIHNGPDTFEFDRVASKGRAHQRAPRAMLSNPRCVDPMCKLESREPSMHHTRGTRFFVRV